MASKRRARTRGKPTHAKAKAAQKAGNAKRAQIAKKAQIDRRSSYNKGNQATGGESTAREAGIMASQKANKIKGLEQSVGSLDRRIQNALTKGNTDTAKDLRSRQNKFTSDLGYARAAKNDGVQRDSSGRIVYTGSGNPVLNSKGRGIFDETKDQDFLDPTRKLQNTGGDAYGKMYPISNALQTGLAGLSNFAPGLGMVKTIAKSALSPFKDAATDMRTLVGDVTGRPFEGLGEDLSNLLNRKKNKQIPYNLEDMPGVRYPLDESFGAGDGATFFGGRSRDPNYRQDFFSDPLEEVTVSDLVEDKSQPFGMDEILESQGIDPNLINPDGNTALQLGYNDSAEAALQKNLASHLDSEGRYTEKLPNPFFLDEQQKIKLREEADQNKRVLSDQEKQILEDKGISEHYLDMYPNTNLTNQSLSDVVDRENTTLGQVGADLGADTLDAIGTLSALNYFPPYNNMVNAAENYADSLDMTETSMEDINIKIEEGKNNLRTQYPYLSNDQIENLYKSSNKMF